MGREESEEDRCLKELSSDCLEDRIRACSYLGSYGTRRSIPSIMALLDEPETCRAAIIALGSLGAVEAGPKLVSLLSCEDVRVRKLAAWSLERVGDESAVQALLDALNTAVPLLPQTRDLEPNDASFEVDNIVRALMVIAGASMGWRFVELLDHPYWRTRLSAAEALAKLGDGRARPVLLALLQEPIPEDYSQFIPEILRLLEGVDE